MTLKIVVFHFQTTLSFAFKRKKSYHYCMSTQIKTAKKPKDSDDQMSYLEKKYGKEPLITAKELKETRWSWH
ncbi:MAG: hypothetical protein EAX86_06140 [Candidatus Heimdallarchaeota archaeon]|nr:hypothetical protein [Candidatus Heimdallarchaeota archaeon]